MITTSPTPPVPDPVHPLLAPFYLGLAGEWVHVEGISTGVDVGVERPSSTFTSLDGVPWEQRAPRRRRTWTFEFEHASRLSVRALQVAADSPDGVWLLDRTLAVQNMLAPLDCYGTGAALLAGGMPLRRFTAARTVTTLVRRGVRTFVGAWADVPGPVGTVTYPGGAATLTAPAGTTAQRASVDFVPDADGLLTITAAAGTTGLQVTEDWLPDEWLPGQSAPCRVAVSDPAGTLTRMDAGAQARGEWSVELREVGA